MPGDADVLTGESAGKYIDRFNVGSAQFSHVVVARDVGPVALEDATSVSAGFTVPEHSHAGSLEAELPAADPGEEATDGQHLSPLLESIRIDSR
jgi:hypothetical protein